MLYVFHVDTGNMMTLDMSLTTESVQSLKEYVERVFKIPADKQVLLISGGECLDSAKRVCSYSSGTDTNPIYLFSRSTIDGPPPQLEVLDFREEEELLEKEKKYAALPPSFQAVTKRAQLAQQFSESAINSLKICEGLVLDQHNQHQGWAAVVANFEDVMAEFKSQFTQLECDFNEYLRERNYFMEFLQRFREGLLKLHKIPVLPKLLRPNDRTKYLMENGENLEGTSQNICEYTQDRNISLFDWIGRDDHDNDLEMMYQKCVVELNHYNEDEFRKLTAEVIRALDSADNHDMKEIRGLSVRLFTLDKLIQEAKKRVKEQNDLATSVTKNLSRVQNLKDSSILPDLCDSHIKQLRVMVQNHKLLLEDRRKCDKAKFELKLNLSSRLLWVMHAQNKMQKMGDKVDVFSENIAKLRYRLGILEQVDVAPTAYLSYIAEIVRRRSFSQSFLVWASELACHLLTIHNEEVAKRKDFQSKFEDHFIQTLFPGMEDLPPGYGSQPPSHFDTGLPKLNQEDLEFMKKELEGMTDYLGILEAPEPPNFLLFKSISNTESEKIEEQHSDENSKKPGNQSDMRNNEEKTLSKEGGESSSLAVHGLLHLKEIDRGCESETDTEEFEKVGQSPLDLNFDKDITSRPGTQDASTLTEKLPTIQTNSIEEIAFQRTLSISGSQSNTESFTNIKNPSLESIDELSSLKNFSSNTDSCFNSHYQQQMQSASTSHAMRSKSISPHTPLSPKDQPMESPRSPIPGHQTTDFVNDEFYIDESLPSSLSIETGQSQGEFGKQLDTANSVVALLQGNLEISRSEYDKLKSSLFKMGNLAFQTINQLKLELSDFKLQYSIDKNAMMQYLETLRSSCHTVYTEQENREKMLVNKLSSDHLNEISDIRKFAQGRNEEIKNLKTNNIFLENRVKRISDELSRLKEDAENNAQKRADLEKEITNLELEKEKCIKEVTDRLNREHKDEMKTLQARFKLMTMERTPSESSLERTLESFNNHESIISQMTENFELEKEQAVKETIAKETEKWEKVIENLKEEFEEQKTFLLSNLASEINEEKDRQIDVLRSREQILMEEIKHYTTTIEQLTNTEVDDHNMELMDKIEALENEKSILSFELRKMRTDRVDMAASVGTYPEGRTDSATSPIKQRKSLTKSLSVSSGKSNKVSIDSLKDGDCVVVVWDEEHESFKVVQDSPVMYFLHSDCIQYLNLEISDGPPKRPNKLYCLGEYVDKEYCHARKSENRYKVPRGTRFFRVKVRPLEREKLTQCSPNIDIPSTRTHISSHQASSGSGVEPASHSPNVPKIDFGAKDTESKVIAESEGGNILSEFDNKNASVEDDSPFMTALYEFTQKSDYPERPVTQSSDALLSIL